MILELRKKQLGGFTFVELYDADDYNKFILGEDEIVALYEYLTPVVKELTKQVPPNV